MEIKGERRREKEREAVHIIMRHEFMNMKKIEREKKLSVSFVQANGRMTSSCSRSSPQSLTATLNQ